MIEKVQKGDRHILDLVNAALAVNTLSVMGFVSTKSNVNHQNVMHVVGTRTLQ